MVDGLRSTVGAIGYFSLGYGISREIPVTFVELDGVTPSVENIRNGSYRVVRPLGVVTSPDAGPEIQAFLAWATSETAIELMESNGFAAVR
jgi:phosphate transport system substrate-binding protein